MNHRRLSGRAAVFWLILAVSGLAGCSQTPPKEFEAYLTVGLREVESGRPEEGEKVLLQAANYIDFKASPGATVRLAQAFRQAAFAFRRKGNHTKAVENIERALRLITTAKGPEYREIAGVLVDLSQSYERLGQDTEAEAVLQRALAIAEKQPGKDPENLRVVIGNLADIYHKPGKLKDAETFYLRDIEILDKNVKQNSLYQVWSAYPRANLAYVYLQQQRYSEAEPLFKSAIKIMEEHKLKYTEVALAYERYAALLRATGRNTEASELEARASQMRARLSR